MPISELQFKELMVVLEKLASRSYTITGASDWTLLIILGGVICALIGLMWTDIKDSIKNNRIDWVSQLKEQRDYFDREIKRIWDAHDDCQSECCPRIGHQESKK